MDLFHRSLEKFTVFRMLDRMERRAQELHAVLVEDTGIRELDSHIEADLPAQCREQCVRAFFLDDFCHEWQSDRFDIDTVSDIHICHDGGWIAVHQDDFDALFTKGAAGLGTGIVKFRSLSDDDRAAADDEDFLHVFIDHFLNSSMALVNSVKR